MAKSFFQMMRRHGALARGAWLALTLILAATLFTACGGASTATTTRPAATITPTVLPLNTRFEEGVAFPRWGAHAYGPNDATWPNDVAKMRAQTQAQWVEMIVSFSQSSLTDTHVSASSGPTPDELNVGVMNARAAGLRVFLKPLLNVRDATDSWNGDISFATHAEAQQWFQSYWAAYGPYVKAAASAGVSQVSLGAEYSKLQNEYPDQWEWLIQQISGVFHGPLTYELNHDTLTGPQPAWLRDPHLTYLGVSMYRSLQSTPKDISVNEIERLWQAQIIPLLDQFSKAEGKRLILSEVGYRNTADCLYQPWTHSSAAPADPTLQGAAYAAALAETMRDPHIAGAFFWAWQNGIFTPGQPATQALNAAYRL